MPLDRQIQRSDAVFSGEVESIEPGELSPDVEQPSPGRVAFDVEESWKGAPEESVLVYGYGDEASFGLEFEPGESYLVYAYRSNREVEASLQTGLCEGAKPLANARGDLRALGPPDTGGYVVSPVAGTAVIASLSLLGGLLAVRRKQRNGSRADQG